MEDINLRKECIVSWRDCAKAFRKEAEKTKDNTIIKGYQSIAVTFEVNAKILEALIKDTEPEKGYTNLGISKDW